MDDMQDEGWQMVPRKDRPTPEDLEDYERRWDYDPDYTAVRRQRAEWAYDFRRDEEQKREQDDKGREVIPGHEPNEYLIQGGRRGFNPDDFDIGEVARAVKKRPRH